VNFSNGGNFRFHCSMPSYCFCFLHLLISEQFISCSPLLHADLLFSARSSLLPIYLLHDFVELRSFMLLPAPSDQVISFFTAAPPFHSYIGHVGNKYLETESTWRCSNKHKQGQQKIGHIIYICITSLFFFDRKDKSQSS
jgi:hypothetical protein